jgi:hypothetical protein
VQNAEAAGLSKKLAELVNFGKLPAASMSGQPKENISKTGNRKKLVFAQIEPFFGI